MTVPVSAAASMPVFIAFLNGGLINGIDDNLKYGYHAVRNQRTADPARQARTPETAGACRHREMVVFAPPLGTAGNNPTRKSGDDSI